MQILFFLTITTASTSERAAKALDKKPKDFLSAFKASLHKINTAIRLQPLTWLSVRLSPGSRLPGKCGVHSVNTMTQNGTKARQKKQVCRNTAPTRSTADPTAQTRERARWRDERDDAGQQRGVKRKSQGVVCVLDETPKPTTRAETPREGQPEREQI